MASDRASFGLLLLCFFASGFVGLLYQTVWAREFAFVFGTSELALAAVLSAYMAGLALGAELSGRLLHRVRRPLLVYALLELLIALAALCVPVGRRLATGFYLEWLGGLSGPVELGTLASLCQLLAAFAVLLPCTALMGATLPLLARHAVLRDDQVGPRVGRLYAVNTAGAVAGALGTAYWLLPSLGLRGSVWVGVLGNLSVFAAAAALARFVPAAREPRRHETGRLHWVLPLMTLSGFASFAYEILWARALGHVLGGSSYALATMLASFLLGIALGSAAALPWVRTRGGAIHALAYAQAGTALLAWLAFRAVDFLPAWSGYLGASAHHPFPGTLLGIALLLPFTCCIGASFPMAVRVLAEDSERAGRASARVFAWNTLGSIAGALGAGYFLLPGLGLAGTAAVCAAGNLGLAALCLLLGQPSRRVAAGLALLAGALLLLLPPPSLDRLLRHSVLTGESFAGDITYVGVGRSATIALLDTQQRYRVVANGLPEALVNRPELPAFGLQPVHWLSLLPVLARPDTRDMLIVGLGGANTLASAPSSIRSIDVIELEPQVVEANRRIPARRGGNPLADPRLRLRVGDARGALWLADQRYDAIVSQPSHPWTSGASHLYTREFFELVRARLAADGVFAQWIGLPYVDAPLLRSLVATLLDVFDHLEVYRPVPTALVFLASAAPLDTLDSAATAIAAAPESFAIEGIHRPEDVAAAWLLDTEQSRRIATGARVNSDDRNRLATVVFEGGVPDVAWLDALLGERDPALAHVADLGISYLARRLYNTGQLARLERLLERAAPAEREAARGWVAASRPSAATLARAHFERALASDPDSDAARQGLLVARGGSDPQTGEPRAQALVAARRLRREGRAREIEALDGALSAWLPSELPHAEAVRLRASWRIETGDAAHAREAMSLLQRALPGHHNPLDYLLFARAASLAGETPAAWAALEFLSLRLASEARIAGLPRAALRIARELPERPGAAAIVGRLRAAAPR